MDVNAVIRLKFCCGVVVMFDVDKHSFFIKGDACQVSGSECEGMRRCSYGSILSEIIFL